MINYRYFQAANGVLVIYEEPVEVTTELTKEEFDSQFASRSINESGIHVPAPVKVVSVEPVIVVPEQEEPES